MEKLHGIKLKSVHNLIMNCDSVDDFWFNIQSVAYDQGAYESGEFFNDLESVFKSMFKPAWTTRLPIYYHSSSKNDPENRLKNIERREIYIK